MVLSNLPLALGAPCPSIFALPLLSYTFAELGLYSLSVTPFSR